MEYFAKLGMALFAVEFILGIIAGLVWAVAQITFTIQLLLAVAFTIYNLLAFILVIFGLLRN